MTVSPSPRAREFVRELLRRKDVQPILRPEDPQGQDIFETVAELDAFLAYTYAARRANLA
jgi:hypothetical protein